MKTESTLYIFVDKDMSPTVREKEFESELACYGLTKDTVNIISVNNGTRQVVYTCEIKKSARQCGSQINII